jgi:hypothetical protein
VSSHLSGVIFAVHRGVLRLLLLSHFLLALLHGLVHDPSFGRVPRKDDTLKDACERSHHCKCPVRHASNTGYGVNMRKPLNGNSEEKEQEGERAKQ